MTFDDLGLSERVLSAVSSAGYTTPTLIQEKAIPIVLERRDVVGIAQTGTGKTASFVLPMLTRLEAGRARARMPRTLILEPTRELAAQVEDNFNKYGINHKLNVALLIGGVSFEEQIRKLDRGVDVLIATPGRLLDLFERGRILMTGVEILVIDEADRMLDMGFIPDIERICKMIPGNRQTLMFSATMPPEIQRLADAFQKDPVRIEAGRPSSTATTVTQLLAASGREAADKRDVLRKLIRDAQDLKNAIIFCNRKRDVQVVFRSLEKHGLNVGALHGDMEQRARTATLDSFRAGKLALLVASDVAARGLDVPDVSHVFNYDVPIHAEDYVHRIGRTGRAGREGTAISIVTELDTKQLAAIESLIKQPIAWMTEPVSDRHDSGSSTTREAREPREGGREGRGRERRHGRGSARAEARPDARDEQPKSEARPQRERAETRPPRDQAPREREQTQPREQALREQPTRDQAPRAAQPDRAPRPRHADQQQERRPRREQGDDAPVVGLGDHVPAFLLRPTRIVRSGT